MKSLFYRPIKINPPPFFFNQKLILFLSSSAIFLTIGILVFAFSLPTVNPPQNNKSKPIDTTNTPQSKQGPLGATLFRDTNNQNYYLNPAGRSKLGGPLNLNNNPIKNVKDPVNNQDVATKAYVDKRILTTTFLDVPTCSSQGFNPSGNPNDIFVCPKTCQCATDIGGYYQVPCQPMSPCINLNQPNKNSPVKLISCFTTYEISLNLEYDGISDRNYWITLTPGLENYSCRIKLRRNLLDNKLSFESCSQSKNLGLIYYQNLYTENNQIIAKSGKRTWDNKADYLSFSASANICRK